MTTFFINIFHQKAKNPRKLPIYPKFDVPVSQRCRRSMLHRLKSESTIFKDPEKNDNTNWNEYRKPNGRF